ncbi:uncharacterized protein C12orf56-like isoform X2 [Ptychodera flava]|uniref:uncharacterized protein C12orf56-like isoform X2 n=1 Tax=Ptychodera flava TaxID=63121 RepID=UPI00396A27AA
MARNGIEALCRRNPKLDTFIKKKLPPSVYERIRAYEECIINSEKEKKAFKHVILSDECIYITENPPKSIKQEDAVPLANVISIEMVNDFPEFLIGEERENTQHISVMYSTAVTKSKKKSREKENRKKIADKESICTPRPDSSPDAPTDLSTSHTLIHEQPLRRIAGDALLYSLNETELRKLHADSAFVDEDRLSISLPTEQLKKMSFSHPDVDIQEQLRSHIQFSRDLAQQLQPCRPLPVRPDDNPGEYPSLDTARSYTSSVASTLQNPSSGAFDVPSTFRNLPDPNETEPGITSLDRRKSKPFKLSVNDTGELVTPRSERHQDISNERSKKKKKGKNVSVPTQQDYIKTMVDLSNGEVIQTDERMTSDDLLFGDADSRNAELHIYILKLTSPFMMHLRSAWNNYIIRATFAQREECPEKYGVKNNKKISRDQLELLFNQLHHEIMEPSNTMEHVFDKVQELFIATEQHFVLKKLFWRSEGLFLFIVSQLCRYLPKSPCNVNSEVGRNHRADELDLTILLVETLALMFRETEIFPIRMSTLAANKGKAALDLLVALTCFPEVPQRWRPPVTRAATLMFESNSDGWNTYEDAEVAKLVQELTNASTAVLYELILIAHQANWGNLEGKFFNICWMMKVLDKLQSTEKFVERLIAQAMRLLSPSKNEVLTPAEAVLLHQQFFVLQTFIEYSSTTAVHIKTNYREEFRYYVQSPYIVKKLPQSYPISRLTLQLINEVLSFVLHRPTKLQYP